MRYKCPSCQMNWEDSQEPLSMLSQPLCVFCSTRHTEKELLNWQMDHIKDISSDDFPIVMRHFYRYVERKIKTLQEEVYGHTSRKKENEEETDSR